MTTDRSSWLPYTPASPPGFDAGLPRATWDEFFRLSSTLAALDRPTSLSMRCSDTLAAAAAPAYVRLFDTDTVIIWEAPPGMLSAAGVWTCPMEGLYQFIYSGQVNPAAVPGNRIYTLELRATRTFIGGAPDDVRTRHATGDDTEYLSVAYPILLSMLQGDTLRLDARAVLTGATASVPLESNLQIQRVSGVR